MHKIQNKDRSVSDKLTAVNIEKKRTIDAPSQLGVMLAN